MAVRNGLEYFFTQVFPKFHYPFLMTGWAEMATLTRKCKQVLVATIATPDTCKTVVQDSAIQIAVNHLLHIRPEKTILLGKALIVDLF